MFFPFSLCIDGPVKGLLPLISTAGGEEGKRRFFPLLYVKLVEEDTYSNPGGGGGEKSLCGEGQVSSSASMTCLLISEIRALPFLLLLIPSLVLVDTKGTTICD
jgi:hypothetical protein